MKDQPRKVFSTEPNPILTDLIKKFEGDVDRALTHFMEMCHISGQHPLEVMGVVMVTFMKKIAILEHAQKMPKWMLSKVIEIAREMAPQRMS